MRKPLNMRLLTVLSLIGCCGLLCLVACKNQPDNGRPRIFNPDNLPGYKVSINIYNDTVITTPNNIQIRIPAHAIDAGSAKQATLLIRSALTLEDMIRGGLTTASDGQGLSSMGMIQIVPAEGQSLSIRTPIRISLPTPYRDSNVRVFRGTPDASGNLNWTDPQPTAPDQKDSSIAHGKALFQSNCVSCHAVNKVITGPSLAYISQRREKKWVHDFIRNNQKLLASGDPYANCIFNQYNHTPMNVFPTLTDVEIDMLLQYIDNESSRRHLPMPDDAWKKCLDTCLSYAYAGAEAGIRPDQMPIKIRSYIGDTSAPQLPYPISTNTPADPVTTSFNIDTFGWHNLDQFVHRCDGSLTSFVQIRLLGSYNHIGGIYILIPSYKVFCDLPSWLGPTDYHKGILIAKGTVALPQNTPAKIFVLDEIDGKKVFAEKDFVITQTQSFDLTPKPVDSNFVNQQLKKWNFKEDVFANQLNKTNTSNINAVTLIKDTAHNSIRVRCNCDCGKTIAF